MKIVGINCSPRQGQTTQKGLEICLDAACEQSPEMETEIIELAGRTIHGCVDCGYFNKHSHV